MDIPVAEGVLIGDRYRLGPRLGRGGMADVYDALDERLARPVAVKLLRPDLAAQPDLRRRFEAEAKAAARLSHPNVVAVHDTGEDGGRAYIVMERLPGETLADRIAMGPLDQAWLRRVTLEVLAALGAAHSAGIVHRDVKPGNILLSEDGRAKVTDFGIAKAMEPLAGPGVVDRDLTATGMVIGTPAYLAPERIDGRPATPQSDLYALGVVMYEGLTGRKPFAGTTPLAIAYSARHEPPADPRHIRPDADPRMVAVMGQAMAHDPAARFDTAAAMAAALDGGRATAAAAANGLLDTTQVLPTSAGGGARTVLLDSASGPPTGRRRWLAALVGLAVVAVTVVLIALVARDRHPTPTAAATTVPLTAAKATTAPTTATPSTVAAQSADPAGDQLRQLAASLTPANGSAATRLQSGLLQVAGMPAGSQQRAEAATALLAQAAGWYQRGQLDSSAYNQAASALQAAGATPPAAPSPPSTKHKKGDGGGGGGG